MRLDQLQTMQITFREICEGRRPWTALGDFLNYWWVYAKDRRYDLVVDPILEAPADEQYPEKGCHATRMAGEHLLQGTGDGCGVTTGKPGEGQKRAARLGWGTICSALFVAERISKHHEPFLQTGEPRRG